MSSCPTREFLTDARRRLAYPFHDEVVGFTERREPAVLVCAYGGGLNSTAYLILLHWLGWRPDLILFADTGGEKPDTYEHRDRVSAWCESVGFPAIHTVKRVVDPARQKHEQKYHDLESECLAKKTLPSIAFYGHSCAQKWKHQPQEKYANAWPPARAAWAAGKKVIKVIGYDADEARRAKIFADDKWAYWYPLLEYDWGRAECESAIRIADLPVPGKSACFYCPSSKPHEILALGEKYPDLLARALEMEQNAVLTSIKGLGKHKFAWADLVAGRVALPTVRTAEIENTPPCACFDASEPETADADTAA